MNIFPYCGDFFQKERLWKVNSWTAMKIILRTPGLYHEHWKTIELLQNEKENALQMDFNIGNIVCRFSLKK